MKRLATTTIALALGILSLNSPVPAIADDSSTTTPPAATDLPSLEKQINMERTPKELKELIKTLNDLISKDPKSAKAFYLRGTAYDLLSQPELAKSDLDQAIKLDPTNGKALWKRGVAYFMTKRMKLALNDFDAAIANGEDTAALHANCGAVYQQLGNLEKAKGEFDQSLKMDPSMWTTRIMRGGVELDLKEYNDALADADAALASPKIPPDQKGTAHRLKGMALFKLDKFNESIVELNQAIQTMSGKDKGAAIFLRGASYHKLGDDDKAHSDLKSAEDLGFGADSAASVGAPVDRPVKVTDQATKNKLEEALKPIIEQSRKSLPEAKERYLKGLHPDETLFVTTRLTDPDGQFEQVFVKVNDWKDDLVQGKLSSSVSLKTHKQGDPLEVKEADIIDWTISHPDGTEEGNALGKFIDNWKG